MGLDSSGPLERQGGVRERTSASGLGGSGQDSGRRPGQVCTRSALGQGAQPLFLGGQVTDPPPWMGLCTVGVPGSRHQASTGNTGGQSRVQPHAEGGDLCHIPDRWIFQDLFLSWRHVEADPKEVTKAWPLFPWSPWFTCVRVCTCMCLFV